VATYGKDFFRIDRSGPTKRLLAVAIVLVLVGSTSIGAHLVTRLNESLGHLISLGGGILLLGGLVLGFGTMAMMLFENVYLQILDTGVLFHDNGKETKVAWSELDEIAVDDGFLVLKVKESDEAIRWFAGKMAAEIRKKLDDARRKALHGLLKTTS